MLLPWVRHRREALRSAPFPAEWEQALQRNVAQWAWLTEEERQRLRGDLHIFLTEKDWEGANGFELSDEIRVTISAHACLLLLGWPEPHFYPNVSTIIVYPAGFVVRRPSREGYIQTVSNSDLLGEAWGENLPVIVSWEDAQTGGQNPIDGHNVVLHEFAHKLDMLDGAADGVPRLEGSHTDYDTWAEVMSSEFAELRRSAELGEESLLNSYGATNEAEFFAVATEAFFELPQAMKDEHRRLYDVLYAFYRQDTTARWLRGQDNPPKNTV